MIYEWRIYEVDPSKIAALNERFANITIKLFNKHGAKVIGFWEPIIGTRYRLYYMLSFHDLAHREKFWKAFYSDPDWSKARQETEKEGPLVQRIKNIIFEPTYYSPLK